MKVKISKSAKKWVNMCGFRARMKTRGGRAILRRCRRKGRKFNTTPSSKRRR